MNLPPTFFHFMDLPNPYACALRWSLLFFSYPLFFVKDLKSSLNLEFTWRFPLRPLFYDSRWRRNSGRRAAEKIANIKKSSFLAQFLKLWAPSKKIWIFDKLSILTIYCQFKFLFQKENWQELVYVCAWHFLLRWKSKPTQCSSSQGSNVPGIVFWLGQTNPIDIHLKNYCRIIRIPCYYSSSSFFVKPSSLLSFLNLVVPTTNWFFKC